MDTLFKNARIMTVTPTVKIREGDLLVSGNRIKQIAKRIERKDPSNTTVIDCGGNLLMPGFKNGHAHSAMCFARSCSDGYRLWDWLNRIIFPMEARLEPGDIRELSKVSFLEYLTTGITSVFDMYLNPEEQAQAAKDFGMRSVVLIQPAGYPERYPEYEARYLNGHMCDGLVTYQLGFHAEYTTKYDDLVKTAKLAHKYHLPVYTHSNETLRDVDSCIDRNRSMRPVEYLDGLGIFDHGGAIFHGVHLSENEQYILRDRKVSIVTNPGSNSKLSSGIAHILYYMEKGINIGLGTDGPGSNNALDFFREMYLATVLQKIQTGDPTALDALTVLQMATCNTARLMRLDEADDLKVGKLADIIMLDLNRPSMRPFNDIARNVVYSGSKDLVKMTMIDGRILYMDGEFRIDEDPAEIYTKAQRITDRIRVPAPKRVKRACSR